MTKTLEIVLVSAEGLKLNRKPVKGKKTLAVVKIDEKSRKSNVDEDSGGSNPTWNYKSEIPMNESVQFIFIEVFYRTGSGREIKIGEAKIPTKDFAGRYSSPEGHFNILSYRLRDDLGDKCGIVNVSIMVKSDSNTSENRACSSQATETGLWRQRSETPSIDGFSGRVVTGVPVWYVYPRQS